MSRPIVHIAGAVLLLLVVVVGLLPRGCWTAEWIPNRLYEATLAGQSTLLAVPPFDRKKIPLDYSIEMTEGVCKVAVIDRAGQTILHWTVGGRTRGMMDDLPAGGRLRLDPGEGTGRYTVLMGIKYHPFSPYLWHVAAASALVALVLLPIARATWKRKPAWQTNLRVLFAPWQWMTVGIAVALSGLAVYPAVHESGHALVAWVLGGEVTDIVFTPLTGQQPHVSLGRACDAVHTWHGPGGVFVPILVAYALILIWLSLRRILRRFTQTLLLTPAVVFLLAGFGIDDHLLPLAEYLGITTTAGIVLIKLIPALLAVAAYAFIIWRIRHTVHRSRQ